MLTIKKKCAELLAKRVESEFGSGLLGADEIFSMLEYPPEREMGDLALPCFKLSRTLRRSPIEIAERLAAGISSPDFSEAELDQALEAYAQRHRRKGGV